MSAATGGEDPSCMISAAVQMFQKTSLFSIIQVLYQLQTQHTVEILHCIGSTKISILRP